MIVTGVVLAGTTWESYSDNDTVTWSEWQKMVTSIKNKVNSVDLVQYYTKTESDAKFLTEIHIPTIPMEYGTFQWKANRNIRVEKPNCLTWYSPKIQVNLDWFETIWDVNWDDIIWTWSVDKGSYWYINGWDYDCWIIQSTWEIIEGCWTDDNNYNDSKVSFTTYCTSVAKPIPKCWSTSGTCDEWNPSGVTSGVWTCTISSESTSCGTYEDPCDSVNPPRYCDGSEFTPY